MLQSVGKRGGQCPAVPSVTFPEEVLPVTTGIDGPCPTLNIDHINFVMLGIFQHRMWGKRQPHLQLVELLSFDSLQLKFRVCILKSHCIWVYGFTMIKCSFPEITFFGLGDWWVQSCWFKFHLSLLKDCETQPKPLTWAELVSSFKARYVSQSWVFLVSLLLCVHYMSG